MPMNEGRGTLWNLGRLADNGYVLLAQCGGCQHQTTVQVIPLAVRLGPEMSMDNTAARLKCAKCGRKNPQVVPVKWERLLPKSDGRWINGP